MVIQTTTSKLALSIYRSMWAESITIYPVGLQSTMMSFYQDDY